MARMLRFALFSFSLCIQTANAFAAPAPHEALKKLETKISALKQRLASETNKKSLAYKALALTEKKISIQIQELAVLETKEAQHQHKMETAKKTISTLNQQLLIEQQNLSMHLKTRYILNQNNIIQWLLSPKEYQNKEQLLRYYAYLIQAEQKALDKVYLMKSKLAHEQKILHDEQAKQERLKLSLQQQQKQLDKDKLNHKTLIQTLAVDIESQQQRLNTFENNREKLEQLIDSIAPTEIHSVYKPFSEMKSKLPKPIQVSSKSIVAINQGLTFLAKEGTPVYAIYPGKVVFSDWLKGYGLLLIIDHGHGYMTLYAHNQSLFKAKGSYVNQGEEIARVGRSGGIRDSGLYFELRARGKALAPLRWLQA